MQTVFSVVTENSGPASEFRTHTVFIKVEQTSYHDLWDILTLNIKTPHLHVGLLKKEEKSSCFVVRR